MSGRQSVSKLNGISLSFLPSYFSLFHFFVRSFAQRQGSVNRGADSWGAATPQTPRDDGLNLARPSAKIWGVGENLGPLAKISAVGENLGRRRKS